MHDEWLRRSTHGWPPKHAPLPGQTAEETIRATAEGNPSRYLPNIDVAALELQGVREGLDVPSGRPATFCRVLALEHVIGGSDGMPSSWLLVESTAGEYHGRPISERRYRQLLARRKESGPR